MEINPDNFEDNKCTESAVNQDSELAMMLESFKNETPSDDDPDCRDNDDVNTIKKPSLPTSSSNDSQDGVNKTDDIKSHRSLSEITKDLVNLTKELSTVIEGNHETADLDGEYNNFEAVSQIQGTSKDDKPPGRTTKLRSSESDDKLKGRDVTSPEQTQKVKNRKKKQVVSETSDSEADEQRMSSNSSSPEANRKVKNRKRRLYASDNSEGESIDRGKACDSSTPKTTRKVENRKRKRVSSDDSDDESPPKRSKAKKMKLEGENNGNGTDKKKKGKNEKKRWTYNEKMLAFSAFREVIERDQLPSTQQIRKFLEDNPNVHRTVDQIRTWASNQKKKNWASLSIPM